MTPNHKLTIYCMPGEDSRRFALPANQLLLGNHVISLIWVCHPFPEFPSSEWINIPFFWVDQHGSATTTRQTYFTDFYSIWRMISFQYVSHGSDSLMKKYVEISLYDYDHLYADHDGFSCFFISHLIIRWSVSQDGGGLLRCCRLQLAGVLDLPGASGALVIFDHR